MMEYYFHRLDRILVGTKSKPCKFLRNVAESWQSAPDCRTADKKREARVQERRFKPSHLYMQIRDELARRIVADIYPADSQLPNEFILAQEMRVSVGTIRKAVEELQEGKLVIRSQGRGTIVVNRHSADYRSKFDRIRTLDGSLINWTVREVEREEREASDIEQERLKLFRSARVAHIRRIREASGDVVKVEKVALPLDVYGSLRDVPIQDTLIENVSVLKNVPITYSDERLTIVEANEEQAQLMDVEPKSSLMRLERVVYDGGHTPVEWRVAYVNLKGRQYHAPSPIGGRTSK